MSHQNRHRHNPVQVIMYLEKTIAVVVPAYNEEKLVGKTITTIPDFVDKIIVVNDASVDNTMAIVAEIAKKNGKVDYIEHKENRGFLAKAPVMCPAKDYLYLRTNIFLVCMNLSACIL